MIKYLLIALGGALGTIARYWLSGVVATHFGETFPWGTIVINVWGSMIIGFFATLTGPDGRMFIGTEIRQFVMMGLCGGFTTFSSFSLQTSEPRARRRVGARARQCRPFGFPVSARRLDRSLGRRASQPASGVVSMTIERDALLLRIFIGEDSKFKGRPLYEAIVTKARELHLAGATVLRGPMGYGHSSKLHSTKILRLSEDLPLIIEIVDNEEKIRAFLRSSR